MTVRVAGRATLIAEPLAGEHCVSLECVDSYV